MGWGEKDRRGWRGGVEVGGHPGEKRMVVVGNMVL